MNKIEIPSIDKPKIKDLMNLEYWALKNNLYSHPAYLKAAKKRENLLVALALILGIVIATILNFTITFLR